MKPKARVVCKQGERFAEQSQFRQHSISFKALLFQAVLMLRLKLSFPKFEDNKRQISEKDSSYFLAMPRFNRLSSALHSIKAFRNRSDKRSILNRINSKAISLACHLVCILKGEKGCSLIIRPVGCCLLRSLTYCRGYYSVLFHRHSPFLLEERSIRQYRKGCPYHLLRNACFLCIAPVKCTRSAPFLCITLIFASLIDIG